jgi:NAD(P)-dependent dehydrogenase (short-subunit alcohol dehydrogenase family)
MGLQLDGRRALVRGSSSGIGETIVRLLVEEGAPGIVTHLDLGVVQPRDLVQR